MYKALSIRKIRQKYKNADIIQDTPLTSQYEILKSNFTVSYNHRPIQTYVITKNIVAARASTTASEISIR